MDDSVEFVHDIRHLYLDEFGFGPAMQDMIFSIPTCFKLSRREHAWNVFTFWCFCWGDVVPNLPDVSLVSTRLGATGVDLSCIIGLIPG